LNEKNIRFFALDRLLPFRHRHETDAPPHWSFFADERAVVMLPPFPNVLDALLVIMGGALCIYIYFSKEGK